MSKFLPLHVSRSISNHSIFSFREPQLLLCDPSLPCARVGLTFDADVAVSLEVVVGGLPGVAVMPQQRDGRPGAHGHVSHTLLVCRNIHSSLIIQDGKQVSLHKNPSSRSVSPT